jgi:hypothetical protein
VVDGTEYPRRRRRGDVINKEQLMKEDLDKMKLLARDLRQRRRHIGLRKQEPGIRARLVYDIDLPS